MSNRLNEEVIANLIRDMASEFIKARAIPNEGIGAYVDRRYPTMGQLERAEKEKQVRGRVELAQNVRSMASEIAEKCMDDISKLGIPYYFQVQNDQHS